MQDWAKFSDFAAAQGSAMNVRVFGLLIVAMGAALIGWSIYTKNEAQSAIAARSLDDFVAAAGLTPSRSSNESLWVLDERKERAEWLLIAGLVLAGIGTALTVAAKK